MVIDCVSLDIYCSCEIMYLIFYQLVNKFTLFSLKKINVLSCYSFCFSPTKCSVVHDNIVQIDWDEFYY